MRGTHVASMQKAYDECYLICCTAVYFENKDNEDEALRYWGNALERIRYHNTHRLPVDYQPKNETENTLQNSLRQMQLHCQERVELIEALKKSRTESVASERGMARMSEFDQRPDRGEFGTRKGAERPTNNLAIRNQSLEVRASAKGSATPSADMPWLRPHESEESRSSSPLLSLSPSNLAPMKPSRTPSPEKKYRMPKTLRPSREGCRPSSPGGASVAVNRPMAAAKAASQAWSVGKKPGEDEISPNFQKQHGVIKPVPTINPPTRLSGQAISDYVPKHQIESARTGTSEASTGYGKIQDGRHNTTRPSLKSRSFVDVGKGPSPGYEKITGKSSRRIANLPAVQAEAPGSTYSHESNDVDPVFERMGVSEPFRKGACQPSKGENIQNSKALHGGPTSQQQNDRTSEKQLLCVSKSSSMTEANEDEEDWKSRIEKAMRRIGKGVDGDAAQQILNEIVIRGDEVHWEDVAGLEIAKAVLKETVVYPFLRPDLFRGLREPARGLLLFGPPGTGKTMLARAVATESKSTFFAISASSLTSKYLGDSEKLVRALFAVARVMAPSIIFVDEIDSLLYSRSGPSEHEASRRLKTEFLIQWSNLTQAAAGREQQGKEKERDDASRVLVLAATNMPWAIDDAARRRFVRRQYIPLPDDIVRTKQLKSLLRHQKHDLTDADFDRLAILTQGFSGSDITALAKDAAMGPLRSLGEELLRTPTDDIRPIQLEDFQAGLSNIRPSVNQEGLKRYEDWAREYGERGG